MTPVLRRSVAALAFAGIATMLAGCEKTTAPEQRQTMAQMQLQATNLTSTIVMLVVTVTAADIPSPGLVFNLDVVNNTASGTLSIPAGSDRLVTVAAYDAARVKTHTGSKLINVQGGTNPTVSITLTPLAGGQGITVTFSSFTVGVTPATATVTVGTTRQLSAQVTDGTGPVTVPATDIRWATANPAVATVSSTGLVTALGSGTVTIMATYSGVGGASTITVP